MKPTVIMILFTLLSMGAAQAGYSGSYYVAPEEAGGSHELALIGIVGAMATGMVTAIHFLLKSAIKQQERTIKVLTQRDASHQSTVEMLAGHLKKDRDAFIRFELAEDEIHHKLMDHLDALQEGQKSIVKALEAIRSLLLQNEKT